jgi:hypothetical protein
VPRAEAITGPQQADISFGVDAIDKVGDEQRASNNRIQLPRFLNQCCAPDSYLESMLLTRPSKNLFSTASGQLLTLGQSIELARLVPIAHIIG